MTPQAQRIAIATACGLGWKPEWSDSGYTSWEEYVARCGIEVLNEHIPDYLEDLNAMHEAEQLIDKLPVDTRSLWLDTLAVCCKWPDVKNAAELRFETQYLCARATASQRAEAFLRTLGLWKD